MKTMPRILWLLKTRERKESYSKNERAQKTETESLDPPIPSRIPV